MKVRILKMRYIEGQGRVRPGAIIEWPHEELGRWMEPADKPVGAQEIDGRKKARHAYTYTQPQPGAKPARVEVRQLGEKKGKAAEKPVVEPVPSVVAPPAPPAADQNKQVL